MKSAAFDYAKPESLAAALAALAEFGDDAQLIDPHQFQYLVER